MQRSFLGSFILMVIGSQALNGCALDSQGAVPDGASTRSPLIFGADNRQDAYAYADSTWSSLSQERSAAMVPQSILVRSDPNDVRIQALPLSEEKNLCEGERYEHQPAPSVCSATLIAPDLVLTAGHCVEVYPCADTSFVFGYAMQDETTLKTLVEEDVYDCAEVVTQIYQGPWDHAVLRLDRPVTGRTPAPIRPGYFSLGEGSPLVIEGYPTGLPLKIANGATVLDGRQEQRDYFLTNLDAFHRNSGSGVFLKETGELVGVLVRGLAGDDYVPTEAGCNVTYQVDDSFFAKTAASYVTTAVDEVCAADPSYAFCHCGDGTCAATLSESSATCAADCGTVCGDGSCNGSEDASSCYADCGLCGNAVCEAQEAQTGSCCPDCGAPAGRTCSGASGAVNPLLGDANGSGVIDPVDALMVAQASVGLEPPFDPDASDVDCDGDIDINDALKIAQRQVGLIDSFPCQKVVDVGVGDYHTCALLASGEVRCWGRAAGGELGYGNAEALGDDETASAAENVFLGGKVSQLTVGGAHSCALLDTGAVRCWGTDQHQQMGHVPSEDFGAHLGDAEHPAPYGDLAMGGTPVALAAGAVHTCALMSGGSVRCWGFNTFYGMLGYGHTWPMPSESPADLGDVDVGGSVVQLAAGYGHTCALLDNGAVRCWGLGNNGALGYPGVSDVGDDEVPAAMGNVDVGGVVSQIAVGVDCSCALLEDGNVRCWGLNDHGQLGYGHTLTIGDDETPASRGEFVQVGGTVAQLAAGAGFTCALLTDGQVRCWGAAAKLGNSATEDFGDDEAASASPFVTLGESATKVSVFKEHACALLASGSLRCWGKNDDGQLGLGNTTAVTDPASQPVVPLK